MTDETTQAGAQNDATIQPTEKESAVGKLQEHIETHAQSLGEEAKAELAALWEKVKSWL